MFIFPFYLALTDATSSVIAPFLEALNGEAARTFSQAIFHSLLRTPLIPYKKERFMVEGYAWSDGPHPGERERPVRTHCLHPFY